MNLPVARTCRKAQPTIWAEAEFPIDLTVRLISPEDHDLCQTLDCGPEPYQLDITNFLRNVYWRGPRPTGEETLLAFVRETDQLFGFGTWKHRELLLNEDERFQIIDVPYFGIDQRFHGSCDALGRSLAGRLFASIELRARNHEKSSPEMPIHLVCDVRNIRGLRFWRHRGFEEIDRLNFQQVNYIRMLRTAKHREGAI